MEMCLIETVVPFGCFIIILHCQKLYMYIGVLPNNITYNLSIHTRIEWVQIVSKIFSMLPVFLFDSWEFFPWWRYLILHFDTALQGGEHDELIWAISDVNTEMMLDNPLYF